MGAVSAVTQGVSRIGGAVVQSSARKSQAEFEKTQFEINARFAELQAEDALDRGRKEASRFRRRIKSAVSTSRAALAGQGINVDVGTAAGLQEDIKGVGEQGLITIQNNAFREAFGFKAEAAGFRGRGEFARLTGKAASRQTLLTGGLQALAAGSRAAEALTS